MNIAKIMHGTFQILNKNLGTVRKRILNNKRQATKNKSFPSFLQPQNIFNF